MASCDCNEQCDDDGAICSERSSILPLFVHFRFCVSFAFFNASPFTFSGGNAGNQASVRGKCFCYPGKALDGDKVLVCSMQRFVGSHSVCPPLTVKSRIIPFLLLSFLSTLPPHHMPIVIRGLALGTLNDRTRGQFLTREAKMAASLSFILSIAGFCRAIAFNTPLPEAIAVTSTSKITDDGNAFSCSLCHPKTLNRYFCIRK